MGLDSDGSRAHSATALRSRPPQACLAMCTVLSSALARVPNGVLRSKFIGASNVIVSVVSLHKDEVRQGAGRVVRGQRTQGG
jgi:hypothetical protein